jgi:hypothetical protein
MASYANIKPRTLPRLTEDPATPAESGTLTFVPRSPSAEMIAAGMAISGLSALKIRALYEAMIDAGDEVEQA